MLEETTGRVADTLGNTFPCFRGLKFCVFPGGQVVFIEVSVEGGGAARGEVGGEHKERERVDDGAGFLETRFETGGTRCFPVSVEEDVDASLKGRRCTGPFL